VLGPLKAPLWEPTTVRVRCARPSGAARTLTVVVLPLKALGEVTKEAAAMYTEALAGELRRRHGTSVLADSDISALLGVEKRKQVLTGCSDAGCLAEVGGALGADRVIHGTVGRLGGSLLVNIASLDARKARSAASVSERLKAADEAFLDALPAMVDRLLAEPAPAAKPGK
jgi:TolB-like protein